MPTETPELVVTSQRCGDVALPVNPFVSNRYHFGMLLGVADLEAEQAYHRGKGWLHNAWLHGTGVVWGLAVGLEADHDELVVQPGLAIDEHGRELVVSDPMCVDLGAWFAQRRPEGLEVDDVDGDQVFDVQVELCHDSCLDRPVPSISEPCEDATSDTAYSRAVERGLPRIVVPRADPAEQYPRLRQFFGQEGVTDDLVQQAQAEVVSATAEDRAVVCRDWFRRLAAADVSNLAPEEGSPAWSPFAGDGCVLLADLHVRLRPDADGERWHVFVGDQGTSVDELVRPAHVRTRTVQELLCHGPGSPAAGSGEDAGEGPGDIADPGSVTDSPPPAPDDALRAVPGSGEVAGTSVRMTFTRALQENTVHRDAFRVSVLRSTGWHVARIERAELEADGVTVQLVLTGAPHNRPVRVVAEGTGATPLLAAGGSVLIGVVGDPYVPSGADAALMITDPDTPED